jgi:putative oxidoreductase
MDRLEEAVMFGLNVPLARWAPQMLGVLRIFVALLYLQSGLSKYFGFPAPPPPNFTAFSLMGLAGVIEIVGSLLLLVGLFTREAAFIMSGEMAVAYFTFACAAGFLSAAQQRPLGRPILLRLPVLRIRRSGRLEP